MYPEAVNAVAALLNAGESVYIIPQNIGYFPTNVTFVS
jgi:hypothetical protein